MALKAGQSKTEIADILKRDKSTISRELKRNTGLRGYRPRQAQLLSLARKQAHVQYRISDQLWLEVERLLEADWSPEQIACRLYKEQGVSISHEWIYQYIFWDKEAGGELYKHLRCQKKRKKRYGEYDKLGKIADRIGIEERPAIVEKNSRPGDWEGDTVEGSRHEGYLLTLVERRSKFLVSKHLPHKKAGATADAMVSSIHDHEVKTLTVDNGKEFAEHKRVSSGIDAKIYFADPYSSWQRGLNENTNGLLKQYFPKGMSLKSLDEEKLEEAVQRLNNRPRKTLGWNTPYEVMYKDLTTLTGRVAVSS